MPFRFEFEMPIGNWELGWIQRIRIPRICRRLQSCMQGIFQPTLIRPLDRTAIRNQEKLRSVQWNFFENFCVQQIHVASRLRTSHSIALTTRPSNGRFRLSYRMWKPGESRGSPEKLSLNLPTTAQAYLQLLRSVSWIQLPVIRVKGVGQRAKPFPTQDSPIEMSSSARTCASGASTTEGLKPSVEHYGHYCTSTEYRTLLLLAVVNIANYVRGLE